MNWPVAYAQDDSSGKQKHGKLKSRIMSKLRTDRSLIFCIILALIVVAPFLRPENLRAEQPAPVTHSISASVATQSLGDQPSAKSDIEDKPRSGWAALPLISYTPETEIGLGGFGAHFFRLGDAPASSRPSSLALVGLYTTRDQLILELIPELYWSSEKWHIWSKLDYRLYPNYFWGVGNQMPESAQEYYTENTPRLQFWLRRMVYASFYLEGRLDAQYLVVQNTEAGGLLATKSVLGSEGGRTVGLGLTLGWDSRDHAVQPRTGGFYELSSMGWQRAFGSAYDFYELIVNFRQFIPIAQSHVLGLQVFGQFLGGEVPFYKMALIGGQRLLRGYYEGRYRDKDLLAAQAEYRLPIGWRFGAVLFVALGDVSRRLTSFNLGHLKWATGGGLRILLNSDERLNLRADIAAGYQTWGIYIGIAEAF
jgi:hypothetical protein